MILIQHVVVTVVGSLYWLYLRLPDLITSFTLKDRAPLSVCHHRFPPKRFQERFDGEVHYGMIMVLSSGMMDHNCILD